MEKKNYKLTLFAAMLLLVLGTIGILYATPMNASAVETTMTLQTISVNATSGGISTTAAMTLILDGNITTAGIDNNAFVDTDIAIKFSGNVTDDVNTRSKINLQRIKTDGTLDNTVLITNSGITIYNKNITINPTVDLQSDKYYLVTISPDVQLSGTAIYSTTTYQAIFKTGTEKLTPDAPAETTFSAIALYPTNDAKDVAIASSFTIGFNEPIKVITKIASGQAIELKEKNSSITLSAVFTVSDDLMSITITPDATLTYGKEYQLKIVENIIKNADQLSTLPESYISFKTTSFSQVDAVAVTSGTGLDISVSLSNGSENVQNVKVLYVVRRDKGARLEDGGTIVINGLSEEVSCSASAITIIPLKIADISVDQFGNSLERDTYVDIFVVNNNGVLLFDPVHISADQL